MPVREQTEAVGHAVRAVYLYSAIADLAAISGDRTYLPALEKIWEGIVRQKLYLTGGIGASRQGESFGAPYELPNAEAYSETCASIAMVFWNYRMFLLTGDGKYIDILERSLYNNVISGVSFSGDKFFYPNPLESDGETTFNHGLATRQEWFPCACCPSNVSRILPSVPGYMYAVKGDTLYINLYASSTAEISLVDQSVQVKQYTDYPENGSILINIGQKKAKSYMMAIRIPGWSTGTPVPGDLYHYGPPEGEERPQIFLNNERISQFIDQGYVYIENKWSDGDEIKIDLPLNIRMVFAHDSVSANQGKVALERGPLVYCFEESDNKYEFDKLKVSYEPTFTYGFDHELFGGTGIIQFEDKYQTYTAIPYYKWSNRGVNKMKVWVPHITRQ
jgi:DUF1680 family protein